MGRLLRGAGHCSGASCRRPAKWAALAAARRHLSRLPTPPLIACPAPRPSRARACRGDSVRDLMRSRWGWLLLFFGGLVLAAVVVEAFEEVLKQHVELSYFVPLLIGHGGNTGSQSNATVIRALALGHLRASDWAMVVYKVRRGLVGCAYDMHVWAGWLDPSDAGRVLDGRSAGDSGGAAAPQTPCLPSPLSACEGPPPLPTPRAHPPTPCRRALRVPSWAACWAC